MLGAKRFDLDQVAELEPAKNPLGLGHMLPSPEAFREAIGRSTHRRILDSETQHRLTSLTRRIPRDHIRHPRTTL